MTNIKQHTNQATQNNTSAAEAARRSLSPHPPARDNKPRLQVREGGEKIRIYIITEGGKNIGRSNVQCRKVSGVHMYWGTELCEGLRVRHHRFSRQAALSQPCSSNSIMTLVNAATATKITLYVLLLRENNEPWTADNSNSDANPASSFIWHSLRDEHGYVNLDLELCSMSIFPASTSLPQTRHGDNKETGDTRTFWTGM